MKCAKNILIMIVVVMVFPSHVFAQSLLVEKNPAFPKKGDTVSVEISSYSSDLNNAIITWSSEGEVIAEGVAKTSVILRDITDRTLVVRVQDRSTGGAFTQSIPISTSQVDLLWESVDSYTPPFYKGKAIPALESNINVVAIPETPNRSGLYYSWEKEFQNVPAQSGRNKNSFSFISTPLEQSNVVSVEVGSESGLYNTQNDVTIRYRNPEVLFYENDSQLGILTNKSLKNGHTVEKGKEISISAIPYFISVDTLDSSNVEMVWKLNGYPINEQPIRNRIKLSGTSGLTGQTIVSLMIEHATKVFEEGEVGITLNF